MITIASSRAITASTYFTSTAEPLPVARHSYAVTAQQLLELRDPVAQHALAAVPLIALCCQRRLEQFDPFQQLIVSGHLVIQLLAYPPLPRIVRLRTRPAERHDKSGDRSQESPDGTDHPSHL